MSKLMVKTLHERKFNHVLSLKKLFPMLAPIHPPRRGKDPKLEIF
jgi:hypothetical protein